MKEELSRITDKRSKSKGRKEGGGWRQRDVSSRGGNR